MSRCVTFPIIVASGELGGTTRFRGRTSLFFFFYASSFQEGKHAILGRHQIWRGWRDSCRIIYRLRARSVFFSPFSGGFRGFAGSFAHTGDIISPIPPPPHFFSRFILFYFVFLYLRRKRKANESRLINTFVIEARDKRVLHEGNVSRLLPTRSHLSRFVSILSMYIWLFHEFVSSQIS